MSRKPAHAVPNRQAPASTEQIRPASKRRTVEGIEGEERKSTRRARGRGRATPPQTMRARDRGGRARSNPTTAGAGRTASRGRARGTWTTRVRDSIRSRCEGCARRRRSVSFHSSTGKGGFLPTPPLLQRETSIDDPSSPRETTHDDITAFEPFHLVVERLGVARRAERPAHVPELAERRRAGGRLPLALADETAAAAPPEHDLAPGGGRKRNGNERARLFDSTVPLRWSWSGARFIHSSNITCVPPRHTWSRWPLLLVGRGATRE